MRTDVVVIGAGPAGLAAAKRAAQAGLSVVLIDENKRVGGQISRLPFRDDAEAPAPEWEKLHPNVEFHNRATCLGFVAEKTVAIDEAGFGALVTARAFVIATGSTERVYPVPGWTKPGVMTAGAGQSFLKGSLTFPYERVVVAGTGPLLLAAASQLVEAGVNVAAVVEAVNLRPSQWKSFARITQGRSILLDGGQYVSRLLGARVPIYAGKAVSAIDGEDRVTGVRIRTTYPDWSFRPGSGEKLIECDAVLFSQGFSSTLDLVAQAGGGIIWNDLMQTWEPQRTVEYETTVEGLYAAGDCAGIGGSKIAALEGELVGEILARRLAGTPPDGSRVAQLRRALRRLGVFRRGMDEVFRVGDAVSSRLEPSTVVCRCQEVTAGDVSCAIATGATCANGVKLWTRAGMGICQGRTCSHIMDSMIAYHSAHAEVGIRSAPRPRFPIRPTSAAVLGSLPKLVAEPGGAETTTPYKEK